jgi:hypothetical protein
MNEQRVPVGLEGLEFPELLEKLTGRVGVASVLRLSSMGGVVVCTHNDSYNGVHVFLPGEDRFVYVTTWVDDAGGALDRKSVELILFRAWQRWGLLAPWYSVSCRRATFPTASVHRSLLDTSAWRGWL